VGSADDAIKVMSYNLFGWNAFNQNAWRKDNVMGKISAWGPAVLGAQEVEKGGSQGYHEVAGDLASETGLQDLGGSQFYDPSALEKHETSGTGLKGGYWLTMTRFKHINSDSYFLFFNSHWKHGHGLEQAMMVADFVKEQREIYNDEPAILVGDTNQFCKAHDSEAWKYLLGQSGSSPVEFEDVIDHDKGKSFSDSNNPDCRVDFILGTKGEWTVRQSDIDREGMGHYGDASDHAPLMAELLPVGS
jgi:endonuclease/exonuclease/phosphatase family metal-dependent hydrolase